MLKVQEIRELIKLIDESHIDEFSYETNGTKVCMKKNGGQVITEMPIETKPAAPQKTQPIQEEPKQQEEVVEKKEQETATEQSSNYDQEITSPMVGTFYQSPSPDQGAFVQVGDQVKQDSVVCIVEAMKLFNEIEAEVSGEVVEILVKDGELVEYGQPMFRVKTV
ncbi:acetyl-CoA carboxylase biotin carboxyl carrier protein [Halobacillus shinanisalinarum]|uniref:Biotin carboxyl carrier protein of acetyl-CoA carboxylase n=1 Tax=Halobacillus shinanisalinarum TaxID=2932258 RepID=A0ABY4GZS4_9BACI|nr:acetyl-CoA carboxylase biotin carboxyl carrier protein [Halobacillus shinanisalinarum]UOQ93701.1 acetyl-CoA carboxylase biotin carboxyl carrier protein [Halobacillus shinanisalinarum]